MELFYEVPAIPGQFEYSVGDLPRGSRQMYELRIAKRMDAQRREVTLGSIEVLVVELHGKDAVFELRPSSSACVSPVSGHCRERVFARTVGPGEEHAPSYWHDPPVPPPRCA